MKLYTSYFQKPGIRDQRPLIAICHNIKDHVSWFINGGHVHRKHDLAPEWPMVKEYKEGRMTEEAFSSMYLDLLRDRGLTPNSIVESLPDGAILLCYEKSGDFCHRRVLADWIEQETGMVIPEWVNAEAQRQNELVESLLNF